MATPFGRFCIQTYYMRLSLIYTGIDIMEGIDEKAIPLAQQLLNRKSRWSGNGKIDEASTIAFIISLKDYDPTVEQGKYIPYIVRQLINGNLIAEPGRLDDLDRISKALYFFHTNNKSPKWQYPKDINQFSNWRKLEDIIEAQGDITYKSKREQKKEIISGNINLGTIVVPNIHNSSYTLYKITEPESAIIMGKGTRWCTTSLTTQRSYQDGQSWKKIDHTQENPPLIRYPEWHENSGKERPLQWMEFAGKSGFPLTASSYLGMLGNSGGPLYVIIQKDNGPKDKNIGRSGQICQFTYDCSEFKNPKDKEIVIINPAMLYAINEWSKEIPEMTKLLIRANKDDNDVNNVNNIDGFPILPIVSRGVEIDNPNYYEQDDKPNYYGYNRRHDPDDYSGPPRTLETEYIFYWEPRPVSPNSPWFQFARRGASISMISSSSELMLDDELLDECSLQDVLNLAHVTGIPVDLEEYLKLISAQVKYSYSARRARKTPQANLWLDNFTTILNDLVEQLKNIQIPYQKKVNLNDFNIN